MAINSVDIPCDTTISTSQCMPQNYKPNNLPHSRLVKIDFAREGSICSSISKRGKSKKNPEYKSPYLNENNMHLLSRVTEKRLIQKKGTNITTSYPLSGNLYKANSDEFKSSKNNKKVKKSVLTLPNYPDHTITQGTVSDVNESEYFNPDDNFRRKTKKRTPAVPKKSRARGKGFAFYDRDAEYCSQMNISLDCSSTDLLKNYNGDGKRSSKANFGLCNPEEKVDPHDVWAVLRNINRFQFRPSPPISDESFITSKKKKGLKRRNNRKDLRVVETCTEKFAYISSYEMDNKSPQSFSRSSSFDRITVINKQPDITQFCKEFEETRVKTKNFTKGANKTRGKQFSNKSQNKNSFKNNNKVSLIKPGLAFNNQKNRYDNYSDQSEFCVTYQNSIDTDKESSSNFNQSNTNICIDSDKITSIGCCDTTHAITADHVTKLSNSGTSKLAYPLDTPNKAKQDNTRSPKVNLNQSDLLINGITKVVLSKGQNNSPELAKNNFRQTHLTPGNAVVMPKLTQTDIKRRLSRLKFPIVILGKDQVSNSAIEVTNEELPQFNGLDEKIWPFMVEWYDTNHIKPEFSIKSHSTACSIKKQRGKHEDLERNMLPRNSNVINLGKPSKIKDKKQANDLKNYNKTRPDTKRTPTQIQSESMRHIKEPAKSKPIRHLKDRMLKLLYKNSSVHNVVDRVSQIDNSDVVKNEIGVNTNSNFECVDVQTETVVKNATQIVVDCQPTPKKSAPAALMPIIERRSWAKAKWASDLIDNVIRKIKNGVYYSHDVHDHEQEYSVQEINSKEIEVQTGNSNNILSEKKLQSISKVTIKKKCDTVIPSPLPGFDNALPALEITTMNSNQIAIKHNLTNILVHFDVTVPMEPIIKARDSSLFIPLDITESHTKIFKCKTSIFNAMLPAELCSILPSMIRNIMQSNEQLALAPIPIKCEPHLSTISEVPRCESPDTFKCCVIPSIPMSSELKRVIDGSYLNIDVVYPKIRILGKSLLLVKYEKRLVEQLAPSLSRRHLFNYEVDLMSILKSQCKNYTETSILKPSEQINTCRALQPYHITHERLTRFKPFDHRNVLESVYSFVNIGISCSLIFNGVMNNTPGINLAKLCSKGHDVFTVTVGNFAMDIPYNCFPNTWSSVNKVELFESNAENVSTKCIEYSTPIKNSGKIRNSHIMPVMNNKMKNKGFSKLYRKCQSTSNISRESTPLTKITSLDQFLQALGSSATLLSNVFDSKSENKIMAFIAEMKKWTSEINPKQALLLLLLMNKKDTSNLLRYRPVLLQGIAVNRITKVNELDMEIEVIERENLNRFPEYEGILYLPSSVENQDNLFEELCWIAKTTASDYQRPFDETSEKLLKSLLEKRKKLNPSYLRVMARYVGLGLLKSPAKK